MKQMSKKLTEQFMEIIPSFLGIIFVLDMKRVQQIRGQRNNYVGVIGIDNFIFKECFLCT